MWRQIIFQTRSGMKVIFMKQDVQTLIEQLYEQNKLLTSAFYEIHGDHVESTSLFCIEHENSFLERNKIMLLLNKYAAEHTLSEEKFWKEILCSKIPGLMKLQEDEFKRMLSLFWKDYVIADEES